VKENLGTPLAPLSGVGVTLPAASHGDGRHAHTLKNEDSLMKALFTTLAAALFVTNVYATSPTAQTSAPMDKKETAVETPQGQSSEAPKAEGAAEHKDKKAKKKEAKKQ
jgi:hypothetical protein